MSEVLPEKIPEIAPFASSGKTGNVKPEDERVYVENVFPVVEKEVVRRAREYRLQQQDAEDLAQNAHYNLWRSARERLANFNDLELRSFVATTTNNVFRNFFRSKKIENKYFDASVTIDEAETDGTARVALAAAVAPSAAGNTGTEVRSIAIYYWQYITRLSVSQKFVYLFAKGNEVLYELIISRITMEMIAEQLNISVESWAKIVADAPEDGYSDSELAKIFEKLYGKSITEKQVWNYRHKAVHKLKDFRKKLNNS